MDLMKICSIIDQPAQ